MPEGLERARKLPPAPRGQPFTERRSCGARRDDVFDLRRQAVRQAFGQLMARDWQGAFWLCCLYWEVAFVRNTSARQRIEEQLDGAERLQRCLVPKTRADREALRRAVAAGVAVRPFSSCAPPRGMRSRRVRAFVGAMFKIRFSTSTLTRPSAPFLLRLTMDFGFRRNIWTQFIL